MHNLNDFTNLYGEGEMIRVIEINSPASNDVFIDRLYKEINDIVITLEEGRKERFNDGEDRLSLEIVSCLRSAGYIAEKDPTHGGHVDLIVRPKNNRSMKWYGEAKIWDGVTYLEGGMQQLLSRYASGRESRLGFFVYFKTDSLISKMSTWKTHLITGENTHAEEFEVINNFSFVSCHNHSSDAKIYVRHFAVNIYWKPEGVPAKKSTKTPIKKQTQKVKSIQTL